MPFLQLMNPVIILITTLPMLGSNCMSNSIIELPLRPIGRCMTLMVLKRTLYLLAVIY